MYMDTEFPINVNQVKRVVEEADVFVIGFPFFTERLLIDTRVTDENGPLVKVVPGVSSLQERYATLREMRPNLPLPEKFTFFIWPRSVTALARLSIWGKIVNRLGSSGTDARGACEGVFRELQRIELAQVIAAVKGEGFRSIYQRESD